MSTVTQYPDAWRPIRRPDPPRDRRREAKWFYLWHAVPVLLAVVLLIAVFETTHIDQWIENFFYDPAAHGFPLRRNWLLEVVLHQWAKYVVVLMAAGALTGYLASFWITALRSQRSMLLFLFLALALGPMLVSVLKTLSAKYCPYDLEMYGGFAPYHRLFEFAASGVKPGRCFPGGHASGGFVMMAFYFIWYRQRPRFAMAALIGGFMCGLILGAGRMAQGAHFLSHNLWSAVIVWLTMLSVYRLVLHRAHFPGTCD